MHFPKPIVYWTKIENLHLLNRNLTNLKQFITSKFMRIFIKVTRLTRQSCKIVSNLDQEFMNNFIKSQTAFLILKDYRYVILNM